MRAAGDWRRGIGRLLVAPDGRASFDVRRGFVDFPGGSSKFTIRFDEKSGRYWSLVNKQRNPWAYRNVVALTSSRDLKNWIVHCYVLRHADHKNHAWQYIDWQFEGDNIIFVSRTAWGDSSSAHDANYFTFHRLRDFRALTESDSVDWIGFGEPVVFETREQTISGHGFEIQTLNNDGIAFSNRKYRWQNIPPELEGCQFTQAGGGAPIQIEVRARRDTTVVVATSTAQATVNFSGWERIPVEFNYSDHLNTPMGVFRKPLKRGQTLSIPQGNWTNTLVLVRPDGR